MCAVLRGGETHGVVHEGSVDSTWSGPLPLRWTSSTSMRQVAFPGSTLSTLLLMYQERDTPAAAANSRCP